MVKITVVDSNGGERELTPTAGEPLMYVLRDNDTGIEAICGGACACATCHVYIDGVDLSQLSALSGDEDALLAMLSARKPNSRLSCQVEVTPALDGAKVTVGAFE